MKIQAHIDVTSEQVLFVFVNHPEFESGFIARLMKCIEEDVWEIDVPDLSEQERQSAVFVVAPRSVGETVAVSEGKYVIPDRVTFDGKNVSKEMGG